MLVALALAADEISYEAVSVSPRGNIDYDVSMISVLLLSLFIGGATIGLSIVTERESEVIKAVAISPMQLNELVLVGFNSNSIYRTGMF
ncbi:MAG: hypothetical protein GX045_11665 [Clostridiaceae bacterium]|jgi:hypothetical protein|nr:hypothetical protein [Clostridiaceae bacterium]